MKRFNTIYYAFLIASISLLNSCSKEPLTPTAVTITDITILNFPSTDDNGAGWDTFSGADIYPSILKDGVELWESETYYEDANSSNQYSFTCNYTLNDIQSSQYSIRLYDFDATDLDDFMGGYFFTPYEYGQSYTKTIGNSDDVQFQLTLSYQY